MYEQIGTLLDERHRPGGSTGQFEEGRVAAEIPDHVHELGDGVHWMVIVRATVGVAVSTPEARLIGDLVDDALHHALDARLALALVEYLRTLEVLRATSAIESTITSARGRGLTNVPCR